MRMLMCVLGVILVVPAVMVGQTFIDKFDAPRPDTLFWSTSEGPPSQLVLSVDSTDKMEGAASLAATAIIGAFHPWGSYVQFGKSYDSFQDWNISDSIRIWVNVKTAPTNPQYMVFRVHIADSMANSPKEEYIYENAFVLDSVKGWVELKIPFLERVQPGADIPDGSGFILAPTTWGGFTYNNRALDRDKIVGWNIGIVTSGWTDPALLPADSLVVSFDGFERFGIRSIPYIFFNGKALNGAMTGWAWGQSTQVIEENAGPIPKTNAIKWTQGNEYGNGWSGIGWDIVPPFNMAGSWGKDSIKFKMKAVAGVGAIRLQLESGPDGEAADGKMGVVFTPTDDGAWHDYVFALNALTIQDAAANFDSSKVRAVGFMAEASAVAGNIVYITDWWTGNPVFDVIAPDAPTDVAATSDVFHNVITWTDTPNEPGVVYNQYFSEQPFTTTDDPGVQDIPLYNVATGEQIQRHYLYAPNTDQNVTYYYGVEAKDEAGNISPLAVTSTATTTMAKGVPTINSTAPVNFVADGVLTEWAGMTSIRLSTVTAPLLSHEVPNFPITDDADLSATAYVAFDEDYLYVAFDVTDDIVSQVASNSWEKDAPDLFIGLYDFRGKRHSGYKGDTTPDYHFRFNEPVPNKASYGMFDDNGGVPYLRGADSVNYAWVEKTLESGYIVEAKISLDSLAAKHVSQNAVRMNPMEGMRIPIDFAINDNDGTSRTGILCYSPISNDNSYQDMWRWTYTWIGNLFASDVERIDNTIRSYELTQNYPNPFNPSTEIRYSIEKEGLVSLKVFDLLGREVMTLVNQYQSPGSYRVTFNTSDAARTLATGLYFYRIESGSFISVKKMILIK